MPFDVGGQFDHCPFDIISGTYPPPAYDGVTIPPWFSSAVNQNPGSNVYKLQRVYFGSLATIAKMHVAVYYAGFIDTAIGVSLDRLASEYGISRISEETDIYERERKIDKFRWDWLEENTVFDYFNVEYLFAYLCKLQILERWAQLNAEEGERVFRELIANMKNEVEIPDEE